MNTDDDDDDEEDIGTPVVKKNKFKDVSVKKEESDGDCSIMVENYDYEIDA
jgi:hypothetical protein